MSADETSVDRRKLIKAMGAGTAIAWVTPSVIGTASAFAQAGGSSSCGTGFVCGQDPAPFVCGDACTCIGTTEGGTVCTSNDCGALDACTSSADCGPGRVCQAAGAGCCGQVCLDACAGGAAAFAGPSNTG